MNIAVLLNMVPDLVEDLELDASGTALDAQWMRYVLSESDEHALEQALLLKDRHGARVTVLALDYGDVDEALYSSLAKGADEAVRLVGIPREGLTKRAIAVAFREALRGMPADLILTGVFAIDDLDGHVAGLLAGLLDLPFVGVTRSVEPVCDDRVVVQKEYPGGLAAEIEVDLPAVIGVLSAPQPPRYVPVARIRETRRTRAVTAHDVSSIEIPPGPAILRLLKPEPAKRAEMLAGSPEDIARQMVAILQERGVLR
ncbi:MAG: electron transfer flavoprotein subunit beta [Armatimonadota bacterium]|nr:electron transfer flavoprotein subunit beta [Armatimonadota bacterium]MDR7484009.1 electron transfer flavoprotein subunit beta [Armatimonadota bacterium]MDR7518721.1 electron transfer flavoprotein subunit beta [Armatimonadota bacterium]MDR7550023.1 electron transfer flavoprotein subunit beta [Armatimonadota bacterium]